MSTLEFISFKIVEIVEEHKAIQIFESELTHPTQSSTEIFVEEETENEPKEQFKY